MLFFSLWLHALFSSLLFYYRYQCNWLPGKICLQNDHLCVQWDFKPCSTQLDGTAWSWVVSTELPGWRTWMTVIWAARDCLVLYVNVKLASQRQNQPCINNHSCRFQKCVNHFIIKVNDERNVSVEPSWTYSKFGDRSFSAAGPWLWKDLPPGLQRPGLSFDSFRRYLKTHLFGNWST